MFSGGQRVEHELGKRSIAAVHFAGRYRFIDFALSNMSNSGIYKVGIIANSRYQSLAGHIGSGRDWDLSRKTGGVTLLPPNISDKEIEGYGGRIDALAGVTEYIEESGMPYVILTDSNILMNIDYQDLLTKHIDSGADITTLYCEKKLTDEERRNGVVFSEDENGNLGEVLISPRGNDPMKLSLGTWVMATDVLLSIINYASSRGLWNLERDVLRGLIKYRTVKLLRFDGYIADIWSMGSYFSCSMDMLNKCNRESLFNADDRGIYTSVRDSVPTKYTSSAEASNCLVADGCLIEGHVENSIIFRNVRIMPGACVKNSIILQDCVIGRDAELDWVVCDRDVVINDGRHLVAAETQPFYVAKARKI